MDWIKAHLHIVASGAVALVAIVLLVVGLLDSKPAEALQTDAREASTLRSLQPVNREFIEDAKTRLNETRSRVEATLEQVREISIHEPLRPDVFPSPRSQAIRAAFKRDYLARYRELLDMLNAQDRPSEDFIRRFSEQLETQRRQAEEQRGIGIGAPRERETGRTPTARPREDLSGLPWEELVQRDAAARANVQRAQEIYCYASLDSFDPRSAVLDQEWPTDEAMWYGQMSLWIQEDMVRAIAALNEQVAEELPDHPWVGNLPVKHLISISMDGYATPSAAAGDTAQTGALGAARRTAGRSERLTPFTQRDTTESIDVIHFTMRLVVDARRIPLVLDRLCSVGFYTPLLINYEATSTPQDLNGYIYGPDPVVEMTLNMEAAFLRSRYADLIPETAQEEIREGRAQGMASGAARQPTARPRRGE